MKDIVISKVIEHLFGRKYYCNVINCRGTLNAEVSSFIFATKAEAEAHKLSLVANRSYQWIETISFRSKNDYAKK